VPSDVERVEQLLAAAAAAKRPPVAFDLAKVCFSRQLPFVAETTRQVTAVCTRRAGKTYGCAAKLIDVARSKPGCVALYITLSRLNAKRLIWSVLKELNSVYGLGGLALEAELCLALPNGSRIYLSGAIDEGEIEKFRGLALGIVIIDEAQSFPSYLERLVDEVLAPALMDYAGQLVLVGTPGPVPVGYFFKCTTNAQWAHHQWTVFDNPHIQRKSGFTPQQLLEQELKRRGIAADDAIIQREWFARWVLDMNALVFRFDAAKNARAPRQHENHVVGVDFGFHDADAIAVLGWSKSSPEIDLVYEWVGAKQGVTPLMAQVKLACERYKPLAVVADTGGLGKKIAEEIQSRTRIPIEAADKQRKLEHIELLNDAMRTQRLFAPADSRFAQDCMLVEWNREDPEKPKISERFHSDICDAVLYSYRRALHWLYTPAPKPEPAVNTPEWFERQQQLEKQQLDESFERQFQSNRQQQREEKEEAEWL